MNSSFVTANGRPTEAKLPCTIEEFLVAQGLLPRSVVVDHNGEAVTPSGNSPNANSTRAIGCRL